jgi:hypothetical protein
MCDSNVLLLLEYMVEWRLVSDTGLLTKRDCQTQVLPIYLIILIQVMEREGTYPNARSLRNKVEYFGSYSITVRDNSP